MYTVCGASSPHREKNYTNPCDLEMASYPSVQYIYYNAVNYFYTLHLSLYWIYYTPVLFIFTVYLICLHSIQNKAFHCILVHLTIAKLKSKSLQSSKSCFCSVFEQITHGEVPLGPFQITRFSSSEYDFVSLTREAELPEKPLSHQHLGSHVI